MTLQASAPAATELAIPRADRSVRWLSPAAGLWVGNRGGDHAGMVERVDGEYQAWDGHGRALGGYPDLDSAISAIALER